MLYITLCIQFPQQLVASYTLGIVHYMLLCYFIELLQQPHKVHFTNMEAEDPVKWVSQCHTANKWWWTEVQNKHWVHVYMYV